MIVSCPVCSTKYKLFEDKLSSTKIKIRCSKCKSIFMLRKKSHAIGEEAKNEPNKPHQDRAVRKILIAHSSNAMRDMIGDIIKAAGYVPLFAKNGIEAISIMMNSHPDVAIVDVALPEIFGFEFPEMIKNDERLHGIKVILIASIYDKTRYKRMPQSLYGANDFIEKHHIRDHLIAKINKLLIKQEEIQEPQKPIEHAETGTERGETTIPELRKEDIKRLKEDGFVQTHLDKEEIEKARRLARIIVSDIALYNQELVEDGVRHGNFSELLRDDIEEGNRFFEKRIPEHIRTAEDFLAASFNELITRKKKELGIS